MPKLPKALSVGEEDFALQCRAYRLEPVREHVFAASLKRKWRFDFAFLEQKIAVEVDGGIWGMSRHTTGSGFTKDCEKTNYAALLGWRVFRFTPAMIQSGEAIDMVKAALA